MKFVTPYVRIIAATQIDPNNIQDYLQEIGAPEWHTDASTGSEFITEFAGRACYKSFAPGLNPNVTKVREGNETYLANIIAQRHGSVMEHGSVTFLFTNVSRVFTHELVRHRVGTAISQESMRYVRLDDIPIWIPPDTLAEVERLVQANELDTYEGNGSVITEILQLLRLSEQLQRRIGSAVDELKDFSSKKRITSFMRRFAPDGVATNMVWTCNMRALRHVLQLRTELAAEEEIRLVFQEVGRLVKERYPSLFQDFNLTEAGEWKPSETKI